MRRSSSATHAVACSFVKPNKLFAETYVEKTIEFTTVKQCTFIYIYICKACNRKDQKTNNATSRMTTIVKIT